jgi:hypothetical protein
MRKDCFGELDVDERIISKLMLRIECESVYSIFIRFRTQSGGGLLGTW